MCTYAVCEAIDASSNVFVWFNEILYRVHPGSNQNPRMTAFGYSQALAKQCCTSQRFLKLDSSDNISRSSDGLKRLPFMLHPRLWFHPLAPGRASLGFTQNFCKASHGRKIHCGGFNFPPSGQIVLQNQNSGVLHDRKTRFAVQATAETGQAESENTGEGEVERPGSSLPPQLRYLTKEVPEPPNYLAWLAGFAILLITREVIVFELARWGKVAVHGLNLLLDLARWAFGHFLYYAAKPIAAVGVTIAWTFLFVREFYAFIIDMTPVRGFIEAIILSSVVLAIGEATRTNAVSSQRSTVDMASFLGLGAVLGFFPSSVFVVLLFALVAFSLQVQKRDLVSSVMPVAAVLAAVAEPWVRGVAVACFLALAVYQNWKASEKEHITLDTNTTYRGQPIIMFLASLMVGICVAARLLYFRHLIWLAK